jgi:hypothetical protein
MLLIRGVNRRQDDHSLLYSSYNLAADRDARLADPLDDANHGEECSGPFAAMETNVPKVRVGVTRSTRTSTKSPVAASPVAVESFSK